MMDTEITLKERLEKANQAIDNQLPKLWEQAELNLKEMEIAFIKNKEQGEKDS